MFPVLVCVKGETYSYLELIMLHTAYSYESVYIPLIFQ